MERNGGVATADQLHTAGMAESSQNPVAGGNKLCHPPIPRSE